MARKYIALALAVVFLLCMTTAVFADGYKGGKDKKSLECKIYYKAKYMLKNEEELGLTDKQVKQIKEIKHGVKKELIERNAQIDLVKVDIKIHLYGEKINVNEVNKLIDKKYSLKKEKAKYLVKAYAELKDILSDKQKKDFKSICRKSSCCKK